MDRDANDRMEPALKFYDALLWACIVAPLLVASAAVYLTW